MTDKEILGCLIFWLLWIIKFILILVSKYKKRHDLMIPAIIIVMIRTYIPLLDIQNKRASLTEAEIFMFSIIQTWGVALC